MSVKIEKYRVYFVCTLGPIYTPERVNPFRTAVPLWGQPNQNLSSLSPKRDCSTKTSEGRPTNCQGLLYRKKYIEVQVALVFFWIMCSCLRSSSAGGSNYPRHVPLYTSQQAIGRFVGLHANSKLVFGVRYQDRALKSSEEPQKQ